MRKFAVFAITALLLVLAVPAGVDAQTVAGAVVGTVRDSTGAVVPNAKVTLTSTATGETREALTDATGYFRILSVLPGDYSLKVVAPAFRTYVLEHVNVGVAVETSVDVKLEIGSVSETVTVTEGAATIEPTKSHIQTTFSSQAILDLPGRPTVTTLALLSPGVVQNRPGAPGSSIVVGGARSRSNNFTIDGTNNNDDSLSIPRQDVATENIAEFQIVTNLFPAEYGRNSGSYINVITKAGTNTFHTGVWYFWKGNGLNALSTSEKRTFNAQIASGATPSQALRAARAPNVTNEAGFNVGGPIFKDKTFFFTSYDFSRSQTSSAAKRAAIPVSVLSLLQANAANCGYSAAALSWLASTFPVANDPTPQATVNARNPNPPAERVCPASTNGLQFTTFNRTIAEGTLKESDDFDRGLLRLDHRFNSKHSAFARYLVNNRNQEPVSSLPGQQIGTLQRNNSLTMQATSVFSPTFINEFRFSYNRREIDFPLGNTVRTLGDVTILGAGGAFNLGNSNFPQFRTDNIYQYQDNLSWVRGRHSTRFGADIRRLQLNSFFAPTLDGAVRYDSFLNFLLDRNATFQRGAGDGFVPGRATEFAAFFQDDLKLTNNLMLNLGVRYEYAGAPFGFFSNAKPDISKVLPRFGFAYSPHWGGWLTGNGKTAIRGGYGIFVDQVFQNILLNNSRNWPRFVNIVQSGVSGQERFRSSIWPQVTPQQFTGNPDRDLPARLFSPNKRISQPYAQQWSLQVQRELSNGFVFQISYVGTKGTHLVREFERNLGFLNGVIRCSPLGPTLLAAGFPVEPIPTGFNATTICTSNSMAASSYRSRALRQDQTKNSILVGDGLADSIYHAMWIKLDKRLSKGLTFNAAYTWSKYISDSDDILGAQANRTLPANPLNLRQDRAVSANDRPHRFTVGYSYEVPTAWKSNPWFSKITGGWQTAGIVTLQSGTPYSVLAATNPLGIGPAQISTVQFSQRATLNEGGGCQPWSPSQYCVPITNAPGALFTTPGSNTGVIGNSGANILRTNGINNFDMAFVKNTRFAERHNLQLRAEFSNIFSHRQFTVIPTNTLAVGQQTTPTSGLLNLGFTNVPGRTLIVGARYLF